MCEHGKFTWRLAWFRTCEQCYEPEEVVIVKRELAVAKERIVELEAQVDFAKKALKGE